MNKKIKNKKSITQGKGERKRRERGEKVKKEGREGRKRGREERRGGKLM